MASSVVMVGNGGAVAPEEEFRLYVEARSDALLRTAFVLTGNRAEAEDLLQTALVKTYLSWNRIRDREAVDSYVRRVMVNTRTSWWRRSRHFPRADGSALADAHQTISDPAEAVDTHDAVWAALLRLPRRQRAAVVLRYYEQLSEAETADLLGISVGAVKSSVSRALAKLRQDAGLSDVQVLTAAEKESG